jgi:hypothetical protein
MKRLVASTRGPRLSGVGGNIDLIAFVTEHLTQGADLAHRLKGAGLHNGQRLVEPNGLALLELLDEHILVVDVRVPLDQRGLQALDFLVAVVLADDAKGGGGGATIGFLQALGVLATAALPAATAVAVHLVLLQRRQEAIRREVVRRAKGLHLGGQLRLGRHFQAMVRVNEMLGTIERTL